MSNDSSDDNAAYEKPGMDNPHIIESPQSCNVSAELMKQFHNVGIRNWILVSELTGKEVTPKGIEKFCEISGVTDGEKAAEYILKHDAEAELLKEYREIADIDVNDIVTTGRLLWGKVSPELTKELSDLGIEYKGMPVITMFNISTDYIKECQKNDITDPLDMMAYKVLKADPATVKPYVDAGVENLPLARDLSELNVPLDKVRQAETEDELFDLMTAYL